MDELAGKDDVKMRVSIKKAAENGIRTTHTFHI